MRSLTLAAIVLGLLCLGLSGCKKEEGPMEKAGQQMDKAVDDAGDAMKEATE